MAIIPQTQMLYFDFETKNWKHLPFLAQLTETEYAEYVVNHLYVAAEKGPERFHYVSL